MIIKSIKIINFGPYQGEHDITFKNDGQGLHLFRGGTGQGKTSLQNAFVWVLYGEVKDRKGKSIPYTSLLNRIAQENGIYYFSIQMHFNHDGVPWILTRRVSAKYHQDKRYREGTKFDLIRDGLAVPNPHFELERIIPNSISRFFFFDGEMLRDYEELLDKKSSAMRILKDSIERILGIPHFRNARSDIINVKRRIERERSNLVKRYGGREYEDIVKDYDFVGSELERIEQVITKLGSHKDDLEYEVNENKRKLTDLNEVKEIAMTRILLESKIAAFENKLERYNDRIKLLNQNLYKNILQTISSQVLMELDSIHKKKMDKYDNKVKILGQLEFVQSAIDNNECKLCGAILDDSKSASLKRDKKELEVQIAELTEIPEPDTSYDAYRQTLSRMNANLIDRRDYKEIDNKRNQILYDISETNSQLLEIKDKLIDVDIEEPFLLETKIRNQEKEIGRIDGLLESNSEEIKNLNKMKSNLDQKISSIDRTELNILDTRINVLDELEILFNEAISIYVEERRSDVETEASTIFQKLRSKADFKRLLINTNFGLSILTSEGTILDRAEWRSAGEEQLVAFSLIGALNKCSNIEAPVLMDSPFGRLDVKHGRNVLNYLPEMADQIILFVTDREIRAGDLDSILKEIKSDYSIIHVSEKVGSKIEETRSV